MNEFIVESKGYCFLCLNQISLDSGTNNGRSSIQYFARYLHVDMRKVFYEDGHDIPPKLLDKVQKSMMKVELCEVCTKLNYSFSVAFRQLEKIQMEVKSKLDLIHQRMLNNEERKTTISTALSEMLVGEWNSENVEGELAAKLKIADVLRNETMEKCSLKLRTKKPRVIVEKLTSAELILIEKAKSEYELAKSDLSTEPLIKMETIPSNIDPISELDDDNSFTGYDDEESEYDPPYVIVKPEVEEEFSSKESKPKTKHKSQPARVKCNICKKSFARNDILRKHQFAIHLGRKFRCDHCGKKFSMRFNLDRHVMTIHVGKRFRCKFCSKTYSQPYKRNLHMKNDCPKRKLKK